MGYDTMRLKGWLKLKAFQYINHTAGGGGPSSPAVSPKPHGNFEVKLLKGRIILGWVTFLALDFRYTLPRMVHLIIVR